MLDIHPVRLHTSAAPLNGANRWHSTDSSHVKVKEQQRFPMEHEGLQYLSEGEKSMSFVLYLTHMRSGLTLSTYY